MTPAGTAALEPLQQASVRLARREYGPAVADLDALAADDELQRPVPIVQRVLDEC